MRISGVNNIRLHREFIDSLQNNMVVVMHWEAELYVLKKIIRLRVRKISFIENHMHSNIGFSIWRQTNITFNFETISLNK